MTTLCLNSLLLFVITAFGVVAAIGVIGFIHFVKNMFENMDYEKEKGEF